MSHLQQQQFSRKIKKILGENLFSWAYSSLSASLTVTHNNHRPPWKKLLAKNMNSSGDNKTDRSNNNNNYIETNKLEISNGKLKQQKQ